MASIRKINGKGGDSYKITVTTGRDAEGKQIRHYKTWKPAADMTARQIEKELRRIEYEFERSIEYGYNTDDRRTFAEYAEYYLNQQIEMGFTPSTADQYRRVLKKVNQYIGHLRITDITPRHLNSLMREFATAGNNNIMRQAVLNCDFNDIIPEDCSKRQFSIMCGVSYSTIIGLANGKNCNAENAEKIMQYIGRSDIFTIKPLRETYSFKTLDTYRIIISGVFKMAESEMVIQNNPAKHSMHIKGKYKKRNSMQTEELHGFLSALEKEDTLKRTLFRLYLITGCRRGELLSLKWDDIDFTEKKIYIKTSLKYVPNYGVFDGETKTGNTRVIPFSNDTEKMLMEYKIFQRINRIRVGDQWQENGYVFTTDFGRYILPNRVNKWLSEICDKNGLPHVHPHIFRHTAASLMISRGVDVLTVSKMLGHADTSTTLNIYAHEINEAKEAAAECVSDVILGSQHKMA